MSSPNRRPSEPSPGRYSSNGASSSSSAGVTHNQQHSSNTPTPSTALPVDNIDTVPPSRRFFPRRPVGSRPNRSEITQSIPSVISSTGGVRTSRASTVSAASRPPTIRLRRLPSNNDLNDAYDRDQSQAAAAAAAAMAHRSSTHLAPPLQTHTRPRSISDPARHSWLNDPGAVRASQIMSPVQEVPPELPPTPPPKIPLASTGPPVPPKEDLEDAPLPPPPPAQRPPTMRFGSNFSMSGARSLLGMKQRMEDVDRMMQDPPPPPPKPISQRKEYNQDVVDLLDVIDPEVSTLSTLTNVQNSLFIPNLGSFINRHPTYDLSSIAGRDSRRGSRSEQQPVSSMIEDISSPEDDVLPDDTTSSITPALQRQRSHAMSITSNLTDSHYAVLPHGVTIDDWSEEDKAMLDDHVRHLLHSKREKFKRGWRGFKQYVKRPLGLFVTIYATLITLFGLAWVLFLIGWIYVGEKQLYVINVIDNVLVALFAIVGDGLAPFRAVDTYHMAFIAHYHFLTWKLRRKRALPELQDHNDLPTRQFVSIEADRASVIRDLEASWEERSEEPVLNEKQQERFEHHSMKFAKSHTYYRPHETRTHYAFPVKLLIAVTVLLDMHSCFQIALGGVTWGISYHHRPGALTAAILSCSITCNIVAGIVISIGDRMTRKKRIIEQEFRQGLTEEAIGHVKKKKQKQKEKAALEDLAGTASTSNDAFGTSKESSRMSLLADEKEKEKEKPKDRSRSE